MPTIVGIPPLANEVAMRKLSPHRRLLASGVALMLLLLLAGAPTPAQAVEVNWKALSFKSLRERLPKGVSVKAMREHLANALNLKLMGQRVVRRITEGLGNTSLGLRWRKNRARRILAQSEHTKRTVTVRIAPDGHVFTVGLMGGGSMEEKTFNDTMRFGELVAQSGFVLLNGGRDAGAMEASAEGAARAGGLTVGILPGLNQSAARGSMIRIRTDAGSKRNLFNVASSDVVVAVKGGWGTRNEVELALKNERPVILLDFDVMDKSEKLNTPELRKAVQEAMDRGQLFRARTPEEAQLKVIELYEKLGGFEPSGI
jgi:uncharacterized protein (TIGR00725 family)